METDQNLAPSSARKSPVLVLGNYQQTITVIRSLAGAGYRVVLGRHGRKAFTEYSRFTSEVWRHPDPSEKADFLASLFEFLKQRPDIRYVFPVGERDIEVLGGLYEELKGSHQLVAARPEVVEKCLNKAQTYALSARLGVPMPETHTAYGLDDLMAKARSLGPPLVIKPPNSLVPFLGKKAIICRSAEEIERWIPRVGEVATPLILQRWMAGERHNCHYAACDGTILAYFEQKVLRTDRYDGTGYGVESVSVSPLPELRRHCESLTRALGYSGVGCVQFMVDEKSSRAAFMEINPRLDATCELAYRCGFDFPAMALYCTARHSGEKEPRVLPLGSGYPTGKRLCWLLGDLRGLRTFSTSSEASRSEIRSWLKKTGASCWKANYHLTWSWTDPLPSLWVYWEAFRALGRRIVSTRGTDVSSG